MIFQKLIGKIVTVISFRSITDIYSWKKGAETQIVHNAKKCIFYQGTLPPLKQWFTQMVSSSSMAL